MKRLAAFCVTVLIAGSCALNCCGVGTFGSRVIVGFGRRTRHRENRAGSHPTLIICHGLPGNEKLLDLAQAVRRAGWNSVAFNHRGSWGSPGAFRFSQNLEDAEAVLAYLRDPANAGQLGIDTHRIVLAGHSMGGWVVVHTASHDHGLIGATLISAADVGKQGDLPHDGLVALMADCMGALAGVSPESMADEMHGLSKTFRFENAGAGLTQTPLLALTVDDGFAPDTDALVHAIKAQGGPRSRSDVRRHRSQLVRSPHS
jgi:uncharacterized protein